MTTSPTACFAAAQRSFAQARQDLGGIDRFYRLGAAAIRVSFAGPALLPLLDPALAHLATEVIDAPDLTIRAWAWGSDPPPFLLERDEPTAGERIQTRSDGEVQMLRRPRRDDVSLLHLRRNLALYGIADPSRLPAYVSAAPFLDILHWWMRERGAQVVHGGAVGTPNGGVLLAGKGGEGKSTTALACLGSELRYAADDYCLISAGERLGGSLALPTARRPSPNPVVCSLYNSAKVRATSLAWFPDLEHDLQDLAAARRHDDKAILSLHPRRNDDLIDHFPLRAILVVRVADRPDTGLSPATAGEVLLALAPSTILQLKAADRRDLELMAEITRRVPAYHLDVGTKLERIAPVITELLAGS